PAPPPEQDPTAALPGDDRYRFRSAIRTTFVIRSVSPRVAPGPPSGTQEQNQMKSLLGKAALMLCAAAALVAVGCLTGPKGDAGTIKIVSSFPRTGSAKAQTDTLVNGIRMAIDEAGGRVGNFAIEDAH